MAQNTIIIPVKVGVVLDLDSGEAAKIGWSCINMAINDFYTTNSHYKTRMILNFRDSMSDVIGAAAAGELYIYISAFHCLFSIYINLL
ncbi:hypothetical protein Tsubulata_047520 [Turnera subulata]|uniref:Uncharacterized protein n=1 Tax=Turnera subulata TaxID=218843 RepID=A0A9Q0FE99_9ROSI|nr:hypothetical protein Tsubulata_047520 [Turnera subulata]